MKYKIAFINSLPRITKGNGVVSQANSWKRSFELMDCKITMCSSWEFYNYESFDAIIIFGYNLSIINIIDKIYSVNKNIFLAPIFDPDKFKLFYWLFSYIKLNKIGLYNSFSVLREVRYKVKGIFSRSIFESKYLNKCFGYNKFKTYLIPLSNGLLEIPKVDMAKKEKFCLHISLLGQKRKNVDRLIDAAIKYNFDLVLAGSLVTEKEKNHFYNKINGHSNITYLGYISEEEKIDLYRRAKVFALPSLNEGVGLVALEAASYGCDIVITGLGGPKEYYYNKAKVVNPYSVDEIGRAVIDLLNSISFQPELSNEIFYNYSLFKQGQNLVNVIKSKI